MGALDGKVVLITGAGQGVGQGIAYALAADGAKIAVTGRTIGKCEDTVAEIRRRGGIAQAFLCEVTSKPDLERCVAEVRTAMGPINILVNNAQLVPLGSILEVTDEDFTDGFDSGPLASMRLMKLCYPDLKGDGVVINLGTGSAYRQDSGRYGAYAAVKEAIRALSRAAACEWGADNPRQHDRAVRHVKGPGRLDRGTAGGILGLPGDRAAAPRRRLRGRYRPLRRRFVRTGLALHHRPDDRARRWPSLSRLTTIRIWEIDNGKTDLSAVGRKRR